MRSVAEWVGKNDDAAIPGGVKERVGRKAGYCCQQCGRAVRPPLRAEFDHITPLVLGGEHRESNLQFLCHECHGLKTKFDVKLKAKAVRIRKRDMGIRKPRKITAWRRMNGEIRFAGRER